MDEIYILTKKVNGPTGHGEPRPKYLALGATVSWGELGGIYPAFKTKKSAEKFLKTVDNFFLKVTKLEVSDD